MNTSASQSSVPTFDFMFYRFNGRGKKPTPVASLDQANFMRSRQSVEEASLGLALQRVEKWASQERVSINPRKPYPSNVNGKYWLEVHFGGLSL